MTADTTLYAKWTLNSYPVTFNSQGGSAVAGVNANYGATIAMPTAPTLSGSAFGGWYKEAGCVNAWNFATDTVTAATMLYAKWIPNASTVTFNSQGGSAVSSAIVAFGATVSQPGAPTWNGYAFGGWYSDASCTTVWNFSTTISANTTLYAKWTINTYGITYTLNSGTNNAGNPATYTVTTPTIVLAAPTRLGYTFGGWYSDAGFTTAVTQIALGSTGAATLYAKWTITTYTIGYALNGGTNSGGNPATYTVTTPTIVLAAPTRLGYTFGGWYSDAGFTTAVTQIALGSTGAATLYAKWTITTYTIGYALNGGTNSGGNPVTYTVTTPTITLAAPTQTGYTFGGWYSDAGFTTAVTQIALGSTGAVTLYAQWIGSPIVTISLNNPSQPVITLSGSTSLSIASAQQMIITTSGGTYTSYLWSIDGDSGSLALGTNGGSSMTVTAGSSLSLGIHQLVLFFTDSGGTQHSASVSFQIVQ